MNKGQKKNEVWEEVLNLLNIKQIKMFAVVIGALIPMCQSHIGLKAPIHNCSRWHFDFLFYFSKKLTFHVHMINMKCQDLFSPVEAVLTSTHNLCFEQE